MGVEWHIGCQKCKIHIWLGSQKPFKWHGFQIGEASVKRFLSLHSACGNEDENGNFLLTNDGTADAPWDEENTDWRDDILSRYFCFDSLSVNYNTNETNLDCAHCGKRLEGNEAKGEVKKSEFLWFCDKNCFNKYVEEDMVERGHYIYDSSEDIVDDSADNYLEVACTCCKTYCNINYTKDNYERERDYEYLALFMGEHLGHEHALKANTNSQNAAWAAEKIKQNWTEYEY